MFSALILQKCIGNMSLWQGMVHGLQFYWFCSPLFYRHVLFAWSFLKVSSTCLRTELALVRLHLCAGLPLLVTFVISTHFSWLISVFKWQEHSAVTLRVISVAGLRPKMTGSTGHGTEAVQHPLILDHLQIIQLEVSLF